MSGTGRAGNRRRTAGGSAGGAARSVCRLRAIAALGLAAMLGLPPEAARAARPAGAEAPVAPAAGEDRQREVLAPRVPLAALVAGLDIPFEQFQLRNGLRVIVHTDRRAPLVHVGLWYDVGARDEPKGRSGFAHLFEHIMFRGSHHSRQDHFRTIEAAGGTDFNGTTGFDRTNYFQTVPTPALELALFLESDRMGWLLPALDQRILDQERAIVLNEKRQGENAPGGLVFPALLRALFPPDHPYSVSAIGRVADLETATLADARRWFRSHYGPNNAVLVLAGDIDAATARPLVAKWFGQIPPGPVPPRHAAPVPDRTATTRETMTDRVAQPRLVRAWAVPGRGAAGLAALDVALSVLGAGPTSWLHERLVRDERLLVAVSAGLSVWRDVGMATISAEVRPGVDPAVAEERIDAVLAEFLRDGPRAEEVARVAMRSVAGTIRGLERIGGFGGKGPILADSLLAEGDPGAWRRELLATASVTPEAARAAARRFLSAGDHRNTLLPGPRAPAALEAEQAERRVASPGRPAPRRFRPEGTPAERSVGPPPAGAVTAVRFPAVERARLSNGIEVRIARVPGVPVTRLQLVVPVGVAGDSAAKPGTQRLMLALLREGTDGRLGPLDGPAIARAAEALGAVLGASASLDATRFTLSALTPNLAPSLLLFADMVRAPTFPADQLERVQGQVLASLASEAVNPYGLASRAAPELMFGPGHPYGRSFSGAGTPEGVAAVTRADLLRFHAEEIRPAEATILAVGDVQPADLLPLLEAAFGDWRGPPARPASPAPARPAPRAAGRIVLFDRPGAEQSVILAGAALPVSGRQETLALRVANDILGGTATSRLNRLLREEKNWTYGAYTRLTAARHEIPFLLTAPVETQATADSIAAIRTLLSEFRGARPPDAAELARAREAFVRSLPGALETGAAVLAEMERTFLLERPDGWLERLPAEAAALAPADLAAAPLPGPDDLVFIVVGDRGAVEPGLRRLGLPLELRPGPAPEQAALPEGARPAAPPPAAP